MSQETIDEMIVRLEADTSDYEKGMERASSVMDRFRKYMQRMSSFRMKANIGVEDRASSKIQRISNRLRLFAGKTYSATVEVKDIASNSLSRIKDEMLSIHGLATAALGVMGVKKLGDATIGAAMDFETQMVSMEHWLKGNKKLAQEYVGWLDQFAAQTPFEMKDIFPAASRGVGITNGDIKAAERLVKLAGDMAGLTPGKTVADAMEAIADAQMGSFERMNEFQMKFSKDQLDKVGFEGFLKEAEKKFSGGAEKLSQTAKGRLSTITDMINTLFRNAGQGILEAMNPRLEKITNWFDRNKETLNRWKNNLIYFGRQGADAIFGFFERVFAHIRIKYLDNEQFQKLDFSGKIKFITDDISQVINNWLDSGGRDKLTDIGKSIGKVLFRGMEISIKEGMKSLFEINKEAFKNPNKETAGSAAIADLVALTIGSMLLGPAVKAGRGLFKAGGWAYGKIFGKGADAAGSTASTTATPKVTIAPAAMAAAGTKSIYGPRGEVLSTVSTQAARSVTRVAEESTTLASKVGLFSRVIDTGRETLGRISKIAGKLAWPLTIGSELIDIFRSKDKTKAVSQSIGGLAGGFAGSKLGASIGTAIAPGVGTLVGGTLGGIGGYFAGKWLSGKAIDESRKGAVLQTPQLTNVQQAMQPIIARMNQSAAIMASFAVNLQNGANTVIARMNQFSTTSWTMVAIATAFSANLQTRANNVIAFLDQLSAQTWNIVAIETAFAANLQAQANSIIANAASFSAALSVAAWVASSFHMPTMNFKFPIAGSPAPHAIGGIFSRPHIGLVAEAGPEAIIPLSSRLRGRALDLYAQVGQYLGVVSSGGNNIGMKNGNLSVSVNGVSLYSNFDIDSDEFATQIGRQLVKRIKQALENR